MDKIIFEISELEKYVDLSNLTGITSENYAGWIGEYKLGKQEVSVNVCLIRQMFATKNMVTDSL